MDVPQVSVFHGISRAEGPFNLKPAVDRQHDSQVQHVHEFSTAAHFANFRHPDLSGSFGKKPESGMSLKVAPRAEASKTGDSHAPTAIANLPGGSQRDQ
jgi:hypothetical protein